MKKPLFKYQFSFKEDEELDKLTREELLKYIQHIREIAIYEKPPKNSNNSSIPPSSEIAPPHPKKNQSLRSKGGKNGGQFGHRGETLSQIEAPDVIVDIPYGITVCNACGASLEDTLATLKEKRQVLDLDLQETMKKVTQYQSYNKVCPNCQQDNHDNAYPSLVTPNISYGRNVMALVAYLGTVHYISYKRIVQTLQTMYKLSISEGTVDNLIKRAGKLSSGEMETIVSQLEMSEMVGIDETGAKVNGSKYWHWVFQNDTVTYIVANQSRGTKVIDKHFKEGFVNAVVVHDNFSSYNKLIAKEEQLCLAHKLRDINYAIECDDTLLMKDMKILIQEAMQDHKQDLIPAQRVILKQQYEQTLDYLLGRPTIPKSETDKQVRSLAKARDKIFTFLLHPNVPPDNNASERAIRNIKVKLKVSGQFKSEQGAKDYATLRSVVDTARKRGMNEFEVIRDIVGGEKVF